MGSWCSGIQLSGNRAHQMLYKAADCGCKIGGGISGNGLRWGGLSKICALIRTLERARLLLACFVLGRTASMNYFSSYLRAGDSGSFFWCHDWARAQERRSWGPEFVVNRPIHLFIQ
jgi:hypothetical protein